MPSYDVAFFLDEDSFTRWAHLFLDEKTSIWIGCTSTLSFKGGKFNHVSRIFLIKFSAQRCSPNLHNTLYCRSRKEVSIFTFCVFF